METAIPSSLQKIVPFFAILTYWLVLVKLGGLRNEHLVAGAVLLVLTYLGEVGRSFLRFSLPFFLTGMIYDSQRFFSNSIRGPIHIGEPYAFDKFFFGITTKNGILTPNEWWQLHSHPLFDLIAGFAYLVFFAAFILIAGYFVFYLGRIGTQKYSAEEISRKAGQMPWAFLWLNLLGYSTYYWYAAAPPWYVAKYGLGPVQLNVAASPAGCIRFDQLVGIPVFQEMYSRAADVFGAIPSLHVAYPLLAVIFAFRLGAARGVSLLFYFLMCFSAVYLNHHYVLDILWGSLYAFLIVWGMDVVNKFRSIPFLSILR